MAGIEIVPYRSEWVSEFREIGQHLRSALGHTALRIDHIGSTSVPGLAAKDVIDVQITVASLEPFEPLQTAFDSIGYECLEIILEDHRPAGNDSPAFNWQKRMCRQRGEGRRRHVHVRVDGAANQRYALLFRDYLRADSAAAGSYEQIKVELARLHPEDIDAYYAVKDPACDLIMSAAEAWAVSSNWTPGASDA